MVASWGVTFYQNAACGWFSEDGYDSFDYVSYQDSNPSYNQIAGYTGHGCMWVQDTRVIGVDPVNCQSNNIQVVNSLAIDNGTVCSFQFGAGAEWTPADTVIPEVEDPSITCLAPSPGQGILTYPTGDEFNQQVTFSCQDA